LSRTVPAPERNATPPLKRAKVLPAEAATVPKSGGACRKGENYKQSQIFIICIETLRPREPWNIKKSPPPPEEHRQECLWYRTSLPQGRKLRAKPNFHHLYRDTTASRAVERLKIATAQPLKNTGRNACGTGRACRKGENYKQSQIFINLYRDTTALRAVERLKNRHRPAPEEHRQECLCYRGRARCFESWMTERHQTRNSATESIPAALRTFAPSGQ
jgi:hypothetical protein